MAKETRIHSSTSNTHRVKILDSSATDGSGLTGLTNSSSGLIISTIADNEETATAYTQAGSTIETVATLGTYAAPTASNCRFREVDATNHPGIYELQFANARYSVASAERLTISISGATNVAETDIEIELVAYDPNDAANLGLSDVSDIKGNLFVAVDAAIGTATGNTVLVIPTISAHDLASGDVFVVVKDVSDSSKPCYRTGSWDESTTTLTLTTAPDFTINDAEDVVTVTALAPSTSVPTAAEIRQEMDSNSTQLTAIVGDTSSTLTEVGKIPRKATSIAAGAVATRTNTSETPNEVITEVIS